MDPNSNRIKQASRRRAKFSTVSQSTKVPECEISASDWSCATNYKCLDDSSVRTRFWTLAKRGRLAEQRSWRWGRSAYIIGVSPLKYSVSILTPRAASHLMTVMFSSAIAICNGLIIGQCILPCGSKLTTCASSCSREKRSSWTSTSNNIRVIAEFGDSVKNREARAK